MNLSTSFYSPLDHTKVSSAMEQTFSGVWILYGQSMICVATGDPQYWISGKFQQKDQISCIFSYISLRDKILFIDCFTWQNFCLSLLRNCELFRHKRLRWKFCNVKPSMNSTLVRTVLGLKISLICTFWRKPTMIGSPKILGRSYSQATPSLTDHTIWLKVS